MSGPGTAYALRLKCSVTVTSMIFATNAGSLGSGMIRLSVSWIPRTFQR